MADIFKIKIVHSQSHLIVPKIVIGILIILSVIMIIQSFLKAKKENRPFINIKNKRFFEENYDKIKFFGSIVLFVLYIFFLEILGFLISSIVFVTLFNILYAEKITKKYVINSVTISSIASFTLWILFGYVFNITLP